MTAAAPHLLVRRMMCFAVNNELEAAVRSREPVYGAAALRAALGTRETAWAQFVLMDAWRQQKLWSSSLPFEACLNVTDLVCRAFGPPPSLDAVQAASGLSVAQFVRVVARGKVALLAVNPLEDAGKLNLHVLITAAVNWHEPHDFSRITAAGYVWRCLFVTARRHRGERIHLNYVAANWTAAAACDAVPLQTVQHLLRACQVPASAAGLSLLLNLLAPTAWEHRPWSRYGMHNNVLDVLAVWANAVRRSIPQLEPWAVACCEKLKAASCVPAGPPVYLREYDPERGRYFACWPGLSAPGGWIPASRAPSELTRAFARSRAIMRAGSTGRILATLMAVTGEIGSRFSRVVGNTLQRHLQTIVPGDQGLLDAVTVAYAATSTSADAHHLAWHALNKLPWLLLVAPAAAVADPSPPTGGTATTLRVIRHALNDAGAAQGLLAIADICANSSDVIDPAASPDVARIRARLDVPPAVALHAAMCIVGGTHPSAGVYSCTMAGIAAFAVPDATVHSVLQGLLQTTDLAESKGSAQARIKAAAIELQPHLPQEMRVFVLRYWILAEAVSL